MGSPPKGPLLDGAVSETDWGSPPTIMQEDVKLYINRPESKFDSGLFMNSGAPCMGNNLAVKVRYALGSRER